MSGLMEDSKQAGPHTGRSPPIEAELDWWAGARVAVSIKVRLQLKTT